MTDKNKIFNLQAVFKKFNNDDAIYIYIMQMIANFYFFLVHLVSIIMFTILGLGLFVWLNIIGLAVFSFNFFLILKGYSRVASFLVIAQVIGYTSATSILFGSGGYFILYFFLIAIFQFNTPSSLIKQRAAVSLLIWAVFIAVFYFSNSIEAKYHLSDKESFFLYFNINVVFLGIILKMLIGDLVKKILESINKKRIEELRIKAHTDQLTGLYNRHYAALVFNHMRTSPEPKKCFVAIIDIDDFKIINDSYGHVFGDRVLIILAKTLKETLRKSDHIFRWGGEEFLVVLEGVDEERAKMVLNSIRQKIAETGVEVSSGKVISYTVTIGASPFYLENIDESISLSDKKLYKGKRKGKNVVVI